MNKYIGIKLIEAEPQVKDKQEGYKVVYSDGYVSWSPKAVFEAAYISNQAMSFGFALEAMKLDKLVTRPSFEKGVSIKLVDSGNCFIYVKQTSNEREDWFPEMEDIFANDWRVVTQESTVQLNEENKQA